MSKELFRSCPESGLQFHKPAELLMRSNAVMAVVILLFGGITALLVTLTRWPAVHLLPKDMFYLVLTAHGFDVLLDNCCDPDAETLEWKPEIAALLDVLEDIENLKDGPDSA